MFFVYYEYTNINFCIINEIYKYSNNLNLAKIQQQSLKLST